VHERDTPPATSTTRPSTTSAPIMSRMVRAERGGFAGGPGCELTHPIVPVPANGSSGRADGLTADRLDLGPCRYLRGSDSTNPRQGRRGREEGRDEYIRGQGRPAREATRGTGPQPRDGTRSRHRGGGDGGGPLGGARRQERW